MERIEDPIDGEDDVSFAPVPSPDEARARLAALRGKPLDAPSRLGVVSEERAEPEVEEPAAAVEDAPTVSVSLPADKMERLLKLLEADSLPAPKAEPQKAKTAEKPLFKPVKVRITTRIDADVLDAFKATGAGWQTMINDVLRQNMPGS